MPDPREVKDALEGLERLYEAGKDGARMFRGSLEAIKTRETPTFTVKEGFMFRRAWYRALRMSGLCIHTGKLVQFKNLVTTTSCRHQLMFQCGICQLLGRFAADTQWDLDTRRSAVTLLGALYRGDTIWNRHVKADQVIFDVLNSLVSNSGTQFEAWNIVLFADSAGLNTTAALLEAVQDRRHRHAKIENLPDPSPYPKLKDIQSALKTYYAPDLDILRVSGDTLDLETCYVNLAIVETPKQREKEKQDLKHKAACLSSNIQLREGAGSQHGVVDPLETYFQRVHTTRWNGRHP
ncbi:hypothetical protein BGZ75_008234 [Mortierella antarctica]|nr:hypothetical protein BGZ75_008234 [Mortierella antarctica]